MVYLKMSKIEEIMPANLKRAAQHRAAVLDALFDRRLDEPGSVLVRNSRYMQDAVAANNVHAVAVELHNSFERVVPKDSSLRTIKDALRAQGALGTLLSGSGRVPELEPAGRLAAAIRPKPVSGPPTTT